MTGSLDVLEKVGKKTFDAINASDPGLKKTRHFLLDRGDKPNLSAILREAKEQEETRVEQEKENEEARKAHFGALFDDFQGLCYSVFYYLYCILYHHFKLRILLTISVLHSVLHSPFMY